VTFCTQEDAETIARGMMSRNTVIVERCVGLVAEEIRRA